MIGNVGKPFGLYLVASAVALMTTLSAHAISRSGGGKLESAELGFIAETPEPYTRPNPLVNDGLRLWSDFVLSGGIGMSAESFVELRTIESEFPDLAKATRKGTHDMFAAIQWISKTHLDSCVDVYERKSSTVTSVAVTWAPGRGIVVLGGVSRVAVKAIDEVVATLRLTPGACGW